MKNKNTRDKIKEILWELDKDFFMEVMSEIELAISSISIIGGVTIDIALGGMDEKREFSLIKMLEESYDFSHGEKCDLETLETCFLSMAERCRDKIKEIAHEND